MRTYAKRKVIKYNEYFKLSPKAHSKGRRLYYDEFITLDTETSSDIVFDNNKRLCLNHLFMNNMMSLK